MKQAVIIFQKNPIPGKTKTRLAKTIGNENALKVYGILVNHAHAQVKPIEVSKYLYFSDFIDDSYLQDYTVRVQSGQDLGSRMKNALDEVLIDHSSAILIGTDCFELTSDILLEALSSLKSHDYCIGPAHDGGYYLIGCRTTHDKVFLEKEWSTESVYQEALDACKEEGLICFSLPALSDCDTEADLGEIAKMLNE